MKRTLSFRGWFKPYYDGLRLMYKRLTTKDAPRIPDLDNALDTNFRFQSKIEIMKLEAIKLSCRSVLLVWSGFEKPRHMQTCWTELGCSTDCLSYPAVRAGKEAGVGRSQVIETKL